jgi:hypothetical protein
MKIEINTTEKTIKLLEDISVKEMIELGDSIKNFKEYKLIQSKEIHYVQVPQYIYYDYNRTNPCTPIWTTTGTITDGTIITTTNGNTTTGSCYNHNLD